MSYPLADVQSQKPPCPDELSYVRRLSDTLKRVGIKRKGPDAPQAGAWFPAYFDALVRNADPPL